MKSTRRSLSLTVHPLIPSLLLFGSDGEAGNGGGTGDTGTGGTGAGTSGDNGKSGESTSGDKGNADGKIAALTEEKDRHWQKAKDAEKERDDALKKLQEIEDKDKSELDIAKRDNEKLKSDFAALQETNQKLALKVAFLSSNDYQWHNPERALALADLTDVKIGEDGKVEGLKKALDALAKSDAYLLKEQPTDDKSGGGKVTPVASGAAAGGKRTGSTDAATERAQMLQKYPALRSRSPR